MKKLLKALLFALLLTAFILAREKGGIDVGWIILSENKDCTDDKPYYICRWLNHSFMPFTKKQERLYEEFRKVYDKQRRVNEIPTSKENHRGLQSQLDKEVPQTTPAATERKRNSMAVTC